MYRLTPTSHACAESRTDWAAYLFGDHAPIYLNPYVRQMYGLIGTVKAYLLPLIEQVSQKPDLATIAVLLIIVFVSMKILDMLYQTVMFWLRLVRRIIFWGSLAVVAVWVYNRGPDGMADDVAYWWQTWNKEHQYWKEQERTARLVQEQRLQSGAAGNTKWF